MKKNQIIALAVLIVIFVVAMWVAFFMQYLKTAALPVQSIIPEFSLVDSNGKAFTLRDLRGNVCVVDFIFTTCGSICPMMTKHMSRIYDVYRADERVRFVSISVNPEFDTPEVLAKFAAGYNIDTRRWHWLTGKREDITNLSVKWFRLGSIEEPVFHSPHFVLLDRKARIRGYYDGTKPEEVKKLISDVGLINRERF